ncbi:proto-oncogene Mas-like [Liasis olivaceus]
MLITQEDWWPSYKKLIVVPHESIKRLIPHEGSATISEVWETSVNFTDNGETSPTPYGELFHNLTRNIITSFTIVSCILGLVGNGRIIYLLAYSVKRNSFTTYILNLSIADLGVLISLIVSFIFVLFSILFARAYLLEAFFFFFFELFFFTYSSSQFLLTAISLDRCVAVLFPLWHHCHRPPYLSAVVCGILWILSFLLTAVHFILHQTSSLGSSPLLYQLIVNGLLCTPLMVVSTVTLWIHVGLRAQHKQKKLLTAILLALLFFLLFSFPMDAFYVIEYFGSPHPFLMTLGIGCAALNSSINPLLYFLVGRKQTGKDQPRASLKVALQRVFKDEQNKPEKRKTMEEDQL